MNNDDLHVHEEIYGFIRDFKLNPFRDIDSHDEVMFNLLAVSLARHQYYTIPAYRKWVDHKSKTHGHPQDWHNWRDVLPFPVTFFKKMDVGVSGQSTPERVWQSSGTTSKDKSRTPVTHLDHYNLAIRRESQNWLNLGVGKQPVPVGLIPSSTDWRSSSLAYMFDQIFTHGSVRPLQVYDDMFELEYTGIKLILSEATQPVRLFGTSYAFIQMFDGVDGTYTLPPGSEVIDTGGYKGIVRSHTREEFIARAVMALGPNVTFINEYGMSELSSQFWSRATWSPVGRGFSGETWQAPYWVRTRTVDPVTYEDDPNGVLVVYDLANVWVPFALQTEDLAKVDHQTLVPLGRAQGAVAKGCSLTAEEAMKGGMK